MNSTQPLVRLAAAVSHACREVGISALDASISAVESLLTNNAPLEVAILGQFKVGKSSFLNSLIGHDILPVGVVPVTAVVTRVRHGAEPSAVVESLSGERRMISIEEIVKYVSEKENPANMKQVRSVEVTVPLPPALQPLIFVDMPGIGSLHRHNTDETRRFLPTAGYALYLVSAERPLGEADRELISEAVRYCGGVAIVMTKCDLISREQADELVAYGATQLAAMLPTALPLFRYSVRTDTAIYQAEIVNQFLRPLITHYDTALTVLRRRKVTVLAETCLDYLGIALRAAEDTEEKRSALARAVSAEVGTMGVARQDIQMIMTGCLNTTRPFVEDRLFTYRDAIVQKLIHSFDEESVRWHGNLYQTTRLFESWLKEHIAEEIAVVAAREQTTFQEKVRSATYHFERYLRAFRDRLDQRLLDALGVKLPDRAFDLSDERPVTPDIRIGRVFDTPLDLLWFLFPMTLFRRIFFRWYRRQIPDEVEKNLFRAVSEITEIINRRIECFARETYGFITREAETLQQVLSAHSHQKAKKVAVCARILQESLATVRKLEEQENDSLESRNAGEG